MPAIIASRAYGLAQRAAPGRAVVPSAEEFTATPTMQPALPPQQAAARIPVYDPAAAPANALQPAGQHPLPVPKGTALEPSNILEGEILHGELAGHIPPVESPGARIIEGELATPAKGVLGTLGKAAPYAALAAGIAYGAATAEPGHRFEGAAEGALPGITDGFKEIRAGGEGGAAKALETAAPYIPIVAAGIVGTGAALAAAPVALAGAAILRGDIAAKKEAVVTQFTKHLPKHSANPEIQKLIDQHNALKAQEAKTFVGEGHNRYRIEHNRGAHPQYDAYNQMDKAYHEAVQNFAAEHPAEYAAHINNQTPLAQPTAQPATPTPAAPQFTAPAAAPPMATMPLSPYNQARVKTKFSAGELKKLQAAESGHATKQQNKDAQQLLESHGYDTGNRNRTAYAFGPLDGTGAEKYDGIVGQQTRASLKQASHSEPAQPEKPTTDEPKPQKTSMIKPTAKAPVMQA